VIRLAEARRSASVMISSSIRLSFAGKFGRLDDEDILAADILMDFDEHLLVGEAADAGLSVSGSLEIGGDRTGRAAGC
jgi:hypothetical protein